MVTDVLLGLPLAVGLQPEPHPFIGTHQELARKAVINLFGLVMDQVHEGHQVGCGPPAVHIGLAKAQIALAHQTRKQVGIVDLQFGHVARRAAFGPKVAAIRQDDINPAARHPPDHLEHGRKISRQLVLPLCRRQDHPCSPNLFRHAPLSRPAPHRAEFNALHDEVTDFMAKRFHHTQRVSAAASCLARGIGVERPLSPRLDRHHGPGIAHVLG